MTKWLYIETVGCQMNVLDSELVVASLRQHGYDLTHDPHLADAILFNTCSVRQHAEDKVYSALGKLRRLKGRHPEKIIGVIGCMAQKDQDGIFRRAPYVDLVVGPGQLHQVPDLIERVSAGAGRQLEVSLARTDGSVEAIRRSHESFDPLRDPSMRPTPWQAYVRIQIGCDKFCTYCIVPMVRGPEQGRPPQQILHEVQALADQGCREITLLGQTVNSYRYRNGKSTTSFADLLHLVHDVDGIGRIKFVTNYPLDMTAELLRAVRDLPKCSPYLHVPAQSGSNRILKLMKRGYTVEQYLAMIDLIHDMLPLAAVSSDFIVGFCSETDEDFQATYDLVEKCRFKNSFIFKYSERPGTKAADRIPDDVPEDVKRDRNQRLLALQDRISMQDNQRFVGRRVEVLVEGPSKTAVERGDSGPLAQMVGRTHCDRIVVFEGNRRQAGEFLQIAIHDAHSHTLFGEVVTQHLVPELHSIQLPSHH